VVPLLISSHSGHYQQIRYLAGATETLDPTMLHHLSTAGIERPVTSAAVRVARAIDDAPEAARILAERAMALVPGDRHQRALFIIGHGPNSSEDHAAWMANLRTVADSVKAFADFRDVRVGLVRDDAPPPVRSEAVLRIREIISLQKQATGAPVAVVPVLVARGQVSETKLPSDLDGLAIVYTPEALLPHPLLARWIEARVRQTARSAPITSRQ
jgi:hypothetical protein